MSNAFILAQISYIAVISILLIILTILSIRNRKKEIGTLKALGFQKYKIMRIILYEFLIPIIIFILIGELCSFLMINLFNNMGGLTAINHIVEGMFGAKTLILKLHYTQFIFTFFIIFGLSALSSIIASIEIMKLKPVEAIYHFG